LRFVDYTESADGVYDICEIHDIPLPFGPAPLSSYATLPLARPASVAMEADGTETTGMLSDVVVVEPVAVVEIEVPRETCEEDKNKVAEEEMIDAAREKSEAAM
jgi:hypothetical protein